MNSDNSAVHIQVDSSCSSALLMEFARNELVAEMLTESKPNKQLAPHSLPSGLGQLATIAVATGTPAAIHLLAVSLKAFIESSSVNVRIKTEDKRLINIQGNLTAEEIERLIRESQTGTPPDK